MRAVGVIALAVALLLPASGGAATSVSRAGVFTGYAFDACAAPSLNAMEAWTASPYRAVGVYVGGINRACSQPNLTASWVQTTTSLGWSLLPLYVGLQAPCVSQTSLARISTSASTALSQGRAAADDAADRMTALALPLGSPVWLDLEGYHPGNAACTKSVQSFVTGWDGELHTRGLLAGVYGSAASTIRDVAALGSSTPDLVWIANWNGVQSVFGDPYVSDTLWPNHQRVHQYKGGHKETYGGVTINVDSSVVDSAVVGGTAPPAPPPAQPPAGQVNSGDSLSTASWPAAAFSTEVIVTLTPMATPPVANGYGVQLTVTETDDNAPLDGFGAPVTVHLLKQPAGLIPAFSNDGATWTALPKLTPAGLTNDVLTAYSVDPDGTIEIQTLVPGYFGYIADATPPSAPALTGRLRTNGLYLKWLPATDNGAIASYTVLRNGSPVTSLTATARLATVRTPGSPAGPSVYRVEATDAAGNVGKPSRAVVVLPKRRPSGVPRAVPHWAYGLLAYQHGHGARPRTAPKKPPKWYWPWAAWRVQPYRLR